MALDISTTGAKITIKRGDKDYMTITQFSDEGTPFDSPDVDVSTNQKNLNGQMISSRTPSVYPFSITVIPGSLDDHKLSYLLRASALQPGKDGSGAEAWGSADLYYLTVVITIPKVNEAGTKGMYKSARTYTFSNCRIKSGPMGPSTSADGRQSARTFTFEAESINFNG